MLLRLNGGVLFVSGTFLASWQSIVACAGGFGHERLSARLRLIIFVFGNSIMVMTSLLLLFGCSF